MELWLAMLTRTVRLLSEVSEAVAVLAGVSSRLWANVRLFTVRELCEDIDGSSVVEILVVMIVDLHHWGIRASAQAFDLKQGEFLI